MAPCSPEDTISTAYLRSLLHGYGAVTVNITVVDAAPRGDFSTIFHSNLNHADTWTKGYLSCGLPLLSFGELSAVVS